MGRGREREGVGVKPFILIAGLRRTGTTLLCDILTELPHSFVFCEPGISNGKIGPNSMDRKILEAAGLPVKGLRIERAADLLGVQQIGAKMLASHFKGPKDRRVIMTGRDPRGISLSLQERRKSGLTGVGKNPQQLAKQLTEEWKRQRGVAGDMFMRVRYEDLAEHPEEVVPLILEYVDSPLLHAGTIGVKNANNHKRRAEGKKHGDRITSLSARRWEREDATAANRCAELMAEYREWWGYE